MGVAASTTGVGGAAADDMAHLAQDWPKHIVEARLLPGSGRMMRSYRLRSDNAVYVCKTMVLRMDSTSNNNSNSEKEEMRQHEQELQRLKTLLEVPSQAHVMPFSEWKVSSSPHAMSRQATLSSVPVYLLRPHVYATLADRSATRPFLTGVESAWIAKQILEALDALHQAGISHGNLSCENIGLTSWNWVLLLDLGSYKQVKLADDDPSDFIQYYQEVTTTTHDNSTTTTTTTTGTTGTSGDDKRCYIAPERFYTKLNLKKTDSTDSHRSSGSSHADPTLDRTSSTEPTTLTPAMDIFSAGCVLMELFLNGERALDLGDLMEYRRRGSVVPSLQQKLNKIESSAMRAACKHMLHLDPTKRLSARQYLERISKTAPIPPTFDSVLYPLFSQIRSRVLSADARIALCVLSYGPILQETMGITDTWGERYFERMLGPTALKIERNRMKGGVSSDGVDANKEERKETNIDAFSHKETEEETEHTKFKNGDLPSTDDLMADTEALLAKLESMTWISGDDILMESSDTTSSESKETSTPSTLVDNADSANRVATSSASGASLIIFLQLVLSSIRHVHLPSSKLVALQLLKRLGKFSSDDARLQRIVPSVVSLLQDQDAMVRAWSIRVLADTLALTESFPPSDSQLFPQYIFKRVAHLVTDPSLVVRVAFAESMALLSETAHRFLDISQAMRLYEAVGDGGGPTQSSTKDSPSEPGIFGDDITMLLDQTPGDGDPTSSQQRGPKAAQRAEREHSANDENDGDGIETTLISQTYTADLASLHETVSRWVFQITTDMSEHSSFAKRALLSDLARLCTFFGHDGVMACVLPQVLAFLNDRQDWHLRAALCQHLPSICAVIGRAATGHFVLPCLETALVDGEDKVMSQAELCLASLVEMKLLSRSMLLGTFGSALSTTERRRGRNTNHKSDGSRRDSGMGMIEKYSPLLLYPSAEVRHGAVAFVRACCEFIGFPDDEVFIIPLLRPYIRFEPRRDHFKTIDGISSCLVSPISRDVLDAELTRLNPRKPSTEGAIQWTSVGHDKLENVRELADSSAIIFDPGLDTTSPAVTNALVCKKRLHQTTLQADPTARLNIMHDYLLMLSRRRLDTSQHTWSPGQLDHLIEGSLKIANSFDIPNQKFVELISNPVPEWYTNLRDVSSSDTTLCKETSALRSLALLNQVYGIKTIQAPASMLPVGEADDPATKLSLMDDEVKTEDARSFLSSDGANLFESVAKGQWGSMALLDPSQNDSALLSTKLESLRLPPLSPSLGVLRETDGRPFSWHGTAAPSPRDTSSPGETPIRSEWKPKVDALIARSSPATGHLGPVTRLAVAQDQTFFVSSSHDGTSRVWEMRQLAESAGNLESCSTYSGHFSGKENNPIPRINDVTILENSHSVATGSSDGSVHVWRVDMVSSNRQSTPSSSNKSGASGAGPGKRYYDTSRVSGSSVIRQIDPSEGEIMSVSHFNTSSSSIVAFATQKGYVHSWDLRSAVEPFRLFHRPELGYLTSMTLGNDRNWVVTGTSRGHLALWDLRFSGTMVKLWQHSSASPVSKLASTYASLAGSGTNDPNHDQKSKPLVFMGCGPNEASIFDIETGICRQCFRVLDPTLSYVDQPSLPKKITKIPTLNEIPLSSHSQIRALSMGIFESYNHVSALQPSINAIVGRIGSKGGGSNYVITGGSDHFLRYWDFRSPSKCYSISGMSSGDPKPLFENVADVGKGSRLLLCRQMPSPNVGEVESSRVPRKLLRGPIRSENYHTDAILDIKGIDFPVKGLLSSSRDGTVKVWR